MRKPRLGRFHTEVVTANALNTKSDLLLLKHAYEHHGLDEEVASLLIFKGLATPQETSPRVVGDQVQLIDTKGELPFR